MAATFSNPRWSAEPCELMRGCSFADNFKNETISERNNVSDTGTGRLAILDGLLTGGDMSCGYDIVTQPSGFSVTLKVISNEYNAVVSDGLLIGNSDIIGLAPVGSGAGADDGFCVWLDTTGVRANHTNGDNIPTYCTVDLSYLDDTTHTITYVVDMVGGTHSLYVDSLAVNTQTTTINEEIGTTNIISMGGFGTSNFTNITIQRPRIFNSLLTEAEHDLYHAGTVTSWWDDDATMKLKCDSFSDDTVGHYLWDATLNLNDMEKGDRTTATTFPTLDADIGYEFDFSDDYITGWPTWATNFTVNAITSTIYQPFPVIVQQNDNTLTDELDTSGTFFGRLHNLTIFSSTLSQIQLYHAEYKHQYWQNRSRAIGAYHRLITEGTCKMALFMDGDRGIYTNLAPLNDAGVATLVTRGDPVTDGCTFASATSHVEFLDNSEYDSDELTISVYGDFSGAQGADLVDDGDMEAVGVTDWTAGSSATLTKESSAPSASGVQCLRIAYNGVTNPNAYQDIMTIGQEHRITGRVRGDGSAQPRLYETGGVLLFTGTTSTDWQSFDITRTAASARLIMYSIISSAGYTEWDDLEVVEIIKDGTIVDKGTDYKLSAFGNQLTFNGSVIDDVLTSTTENIAVACKPGFAPRFYANGEYIANGDSTVTPVPDSTDVTIGNDNAYADVCDFALKQVYIGDKALSDREIKALYVQAQTIGATPMETGQRIAVAKEDFAGAVDYDVDPGDNFQLIDIVITFDAAPTTPENITIFSIRESVKITEFEFDPSTSANTQHMFRFDKRLDSGVTYGIDYTNTDANNIDVYSTYQLDPSVT